MTIVTITEKNYPDTSRGTPFSKVDFIERTVKVDNALAYKEVYVPGTTSNSHLSRFLESLTAKNQGNQVPEIANNAKQI